MTTYESSYKSASPKRMNGAIGAKPIVIKKKFAEESSSVDETLDSKNRP